MTGIDPESSLPESPEEAAQTGTLIASLALKQRAGGIAVPAVTVVVAFVMGGLVVLATGQKPLIPYLATFNGRGLGFRLPGPHVQHRRPGAVPGRAGRRKLARGRLRRDEPVPAHPDRGR